MKRPLQGKHMFYPFVCSELKRDEASDSASEIQAGFEDVGEDMLKQLERGCTLLKERFFRKEDDTIQEKA